VVAIRFEPRGVQEFPFCSYHDRRTEGGAHLKGWDPNQIKSTRNL
jgi:hypothetical protein